MSDNTDLGALENAGLIIERFGGIRPMAGKMGVPVTTVQGWKKRDVIPGNRVDDVVAAARKHDISLDGLMDIAKAGDISADKPNHTAQHAASGGSSSSASGGADARSSVARPAPEKTSEKAKTSEKTPDDLIRHIKTAQKTAIKSSVLYATALVVALGGIGAFLLWPTKQQIHENGERLAVLESDVADVRKSQGFLRGIVPEDLNRRFDELQEQARTIQSTVKTLGEQADSISRDVLDPQATMSQRLQRVETHISQLGAPAQLSALLRRIRTLEETLQGQEHLDQAMAALHGFLSKDEAGLYDIEDLLLQAKEEEEIIAETFQGVPSSDIKAASMLLVLSQFRSSLNRNAPFEDDLELMYKLLGDDPDPALMASIERLAPQAGRGVLSPHGLSNELRGMTGDIVVASLKGEDVSVREQALARLNTVLQVEKDGELITGTDTQAQIVKAQRYLDQGDVPAALAALEKLEGGAAEAARPLITEAEITLLAEQVQGMFAGEVLKRSGGTGITARGGGARIIAGAPSSAIDLRQLLQEIEEFVPGHYGRVVRDEESGFSILTRPGIPGR